MKADQFGPNLSDYLLLVVLAIICGAAIVTGNSFGTSSDTKAIVYRGNDLVEVVKLDGKSRTIDLGPMVLETGPKGIRVLKSDCTHQICAHKGWISRPGETLVCVPRKTMIEVTGDKTKSQFDALSY